MHGVYMVYAWYTHGIYMVYNVAYLPLLERVDGVCIVIPCIYKVVYLPLLECMDGAAVAQVISVLVARPQRRALPVRPGWG